MIELMSVLTCPECMGTVPVQMPTDSCQFFYECPECGVLMRPRPGDCCVFCSYGTVPCPPRQAGEHCCGQDAAAIVPIRAIQSTKDAIARGLR